MDKRLRPGIAILEPYNNGATTLKRLHHLRLQHQQQAPQQHAEVSQPQHRSVATVNRSMSVHKGSNGKSGLLPLCLDSGG
ncbi:hypothetical protein HAX54_026206, partial [Datura stramonium]|nr:hypothetical protein [Datura stramonium]